MEGEFGPDLAAVISVLQTALTPAFLLVAVGSLLNVLTGRLARIVDRSRDLQRQYPNTEGTAHERVVRELRIIEKRMRVVGSSILFAVLSAISVCVMIVALFVLGLTNTHAAWVAVALFMLALALLSACLFQFVGEIRLATYAIYVPEEYLELPPPRKPKERKRHKPIKRLTAFFTQLLHARNDFVANIGSYKLPDFAAVNCNFLHQPRGNGL